MMDRLTHSGTKEAKSNVTIGDVLNKLAHYEDLAEAGRLVELPCAVGDTVWEVRWWDEVTESKVIDGKTYFRKVMKRKVTKTQFSLFDYENFGKVVFLTKAEAEAALKERETEWII